MIPGEFLECLVRDVQSPVPAGGTVCLEGFLAIILGIKIDPLQLLVTVDSGTLSPRRPHGAEGHQTGENDAPDIIIERGLHWD